MTYFGFLACFLGVPLLILTWATWRDARRRVTLPETWAAPAPWAVLLAHIALAVIYTTPWDNYLVANRVWYYDPARVTGVTLGWVPIEEYTFFVVQTLLTGMWLLWLGRHLSPASGPVRYSPQLRRVTVGCGMAIWLAALVLLVSGRPPGTYMALILAWMLPPILLQLGVGADILWHHRRWAALSLAAPTLYLAVADSVAIAARVWTINPAKSTGIMLGGVLPAEEFVFFVITNVLIVFGMTLALTTGRELYHRIAHLRARSRSDAAETHTE
jgi:lycopene beta-cyclase